MSIKREDISLSQFKEEFNPEQLYAIHWSKQQGLTVLLHSNQAIHIIPDNHPGEFTYSEINTIRPQLLRDAGINDLVNHIVTIERLGEATNFRVRDKKLDQANRTYEIMQSLKENEGNSVIPPWERGNTPNTENTPIEPATPGAMATLQIPTTVVRTLSTDEPVTEEYHILTTAITRSHKSPDGNLHVTFANENWELNVPATSRTIQDFNQKVRGTRTGRRDTENTERNYLGKIGGYLNAQDATAAAAAKEQARRDKSSTEQENSR